MWGIKQNKSYLFLCFSVSAFIYNLFNDAVINSDYIAPNDIIINKRWMRKNMTVAQFKILSRYLPQGTEENRQAPHSE
jgi:hypothetical protein